MPELPPGFVSNNLLSFNFSCDLFGTPAHHSEPILLLTNVDSAKLKHENLTSKIVSREFIVIKEKYYKI